MIVWRWLAALAAGLMVAACQGIVGDPNPLLRQGYEAIRDGDIARLRAVSAPEMITPQLEGQVAALRRMLPPGAPSETKALGRHTTTTLGAGQILDATDLYAFKDHKVVVVGRMVRASETDRWRLQGINVQVLAAKDLAQNALTFAGKGAGHYAFLLATIASPLLMVAALVKVVRRKGLRRKWLWGLLAFAGLFIVQMNWTTGEVAVQWLTIQFIGAGLTSTSADGLAPWFAQFTLPVGAVLILTGVWANPARARPPKDRAPASPTTFD